MRELQVAVQTHWFYLIPVYDQMQLSATTSHWHEQRKAEIKMIALSLVPYCAQYELMVNLKQLTLPR